jgi:hypothetical protein
MRRRSQANCRAVPILKSSHRFSQRAGLNFVRGSLGAENRGGTSDAGLAPALRLASCKLAKASA